MVRLSSIALAASTLFAVVHGSAIVPQAPSQGDDTVRPKERWSYANCGSPTDPLQIESIELSPESPKPGQDISVTAVVVAQETIQEGAYADVTVKVGVIRLLQKQFDLCEEARKANVSTQCPVEPGRYTIEYTTKLPREIPPARFSINANAFTVNDDDLFCLQVYVDFTKKPF